MDSPDSALSQWRLKVLHEDSFSLSFYLISVNPLKIEVYTHITCLTHTLLTHKGSPVLIISTISTELACHIMALTVGNTAMQNVEPDPKTTGFTKFLLGHCDSTQSFTEKKQTYCNEGLFHR